jgi:hypothetical protein
MTLSAEEFLRRFLLHVLPRGFVRIRFFGFMANQRRASLLPVCKKLVGEELQQEPLLAPSKDHKQSAWSCPICGSPMVVLQRLTAQQITWESLKRINVSDTS